MNESRPTEQQLEQDLRRRYGIDLATLRAMYRDWKEDGVPKSVVEARYLRTRRQHGKLFSRLVREYLDVETQSAHPLRRRVEELTEEVVALRAEIERLRERLRSGGLNDDA